MGVLKIRILKIYLIIEFIKKKLNLKIRILENNLKIGVLKIGILKKNKKKKFVWEWNLKKKKLKIIWEWDCLKIKFLKD